MATHVRNNPAQVVRQAFARRERRERLLAEAMRRHGIAGLRAVFDLLEAHLGEEIGIDRQLERLIDAEPTALALLAAKDRRR
jgi:hypothetical protein